MNKTKKIINTVLAAALFLFAACSGVTNNYDSNAAYTVSGKLSDGSNSNTARTAIAAPSYEDYTWKVFAEKEGEEKIEGTVSDMNFTLKIPVSGKWTLTAEGRNDSGLKLTGTKEINIENSDIENVIIKVAPDNSGKGLVSLKITDKTNKIAAASYTVKDKIKGIADGTITFNSDHNALLKIESAAAGAHEFTFKFYDANQKELFVTTDTINVYSGLTTDTWYFDGKTSDVWTIQDSDLKIEVLVSASGTIDFTTLQPGDLEIALDADNSSEEFYPNYFKMAFNAVDANGKRITGDVDWNATLYYGGKAVPDEYYTFAPADGEYHCAFQNKTDKELLTIGQYQLFVVAAYEGKKYSNTFTFNVLDGYYFEVSVQDSAAYNAMIQKLPDITDHVIIKLKGDASEMSDDPMSQIFQKLNSVADLDFSQLEGITAIADNEFNNTSPEKVNIFRQVLSLKAPRTITKVGDSAFKNCKKITEFDLPDSVTEIGANAFEACSSLVTVNVPEQLTTIGDSAFADCEKLESFDIPSTITSIGEGAFYNCKQLTSVSIPSNVTVVSENLFRRCLNLKTVTIAKGVKTIGKEAFGECAALTKVDIPASVKTIAENAFNYCENLSSVILPEGLETIEKGAFRRCPVTEIKLPSTLKKLSGFNETHLTSITIPASVTTIGDEAFYSDEIITSVTFESGSQLVEIGDSAFLYMTGLEEIKLPGSLKVIGNNAFSQCWSLKIVDFGTSDLRAIGASVFSGSSKLKTITYTASGNVGSGKWIYGFEDYEDIGDPWENIKSAVLEGTTPADLPDLSAELNVLENFNDISNINEYFFYFYKK